MTISSTANKAIGYGNGVATNWPHKFLIPNANQLTVILTDPSGNQTTLSPSQYAVSGIGNRNGGTVTYPLSGAPLPVGWSITRLRVLPIVQQTDIVNQNGFYPDVVESAMDYQTMTQQQLAEQQTRSIAFPVVDDQTVINPVLPAAAARATKPLIFDSSGNVVTGQQSYIEPGTLLNLAQSVAEILVAGVAPGAGTGAFIQFGTGAQTRAFQDKMRDVISALDFMTPAQVNDVRNNVGSIDVSAAIQAALNTMHPVYLPAGTYYLASSLKFSSGMVLFGAAGYGNGVSAGSPTILKPATCAIQTANYQAQYQFCSVADIGITGGTLQMDFGLFHGVRIERVWHYNASVGCCMITRGERHTIKNINCYTGNQDCFGYALGRWEESLNPGTGAQAYSDAYFGSAGPFFDRSDVGGMVFGNAGTGAFTYSILSDMMSGTHFSNMVTYSNGKGTERAVMYVRTRIQACVLNTWNPDHLGSVASPVPAMFYFGQVLECTFINCSPQFAGNNVYTYGFQVVGGDFLGTFINCRADGDNVTSYGWWVGNSVGQGGTLINCRGAFFHASTSDQIRNQVTKLDCAFSADNGTNGAQAIHCNTNNQDAVLNLMADTNGATAATSHFRVNVATGGGGEKTALSVGADGISVIGTAGTGSPAAGAAGALPATPAGYLTMTINGTQRQVPYY